MYTLRIMYKTLKLYTYIELVSMLADSAELFQVHVSA